MLAEHKVVQQRQRDARSMSVNSKSFEQMTTHIHTHELKRYIDQQNDIPVLITSKWIKDNVNVTEKALAGIAHTTGRLKSRG